MTALRQQLEAALEAHQKVLAEKEAREKLLQELETTGTLGMRKREGIHNTQANKQSKIPSKQFLHIDAQMLCGVCPSSTLLICT